MRTIIMYLDNFIHHKIRDDYPEEQIYNYDNVQYYHIPEKYRNMEDTLNKLLATFSDDRYFLDQYKLKSDKKYHLYQYIAENDWCILISCGPDGVFEQDMIKSIKNEKENISLKEISRRIKEIQYDTTNGIKSRGDIIVTSDKLTPCLVGMRPDGVFE